MPLAKRADAGISEIFRGGATPPEAIRAAEWDDLKVHFENGGIQDVPLRTHIGKGRETRVIDLEGGERHLEKVVFRYETQGRGNRRATVILKGRR